MPDTSPGILDSRASYSLMDTLFVILGIVLVLVALWVLWFCCSRKRKQRKGVPLKLHVLVTGTTMGVQTTFLGKLLQRIRFSAVTSTEHCDVIIAFCPVSSRIGTDIDDALNKISDHKPAILVVLHHTPYLDSIVAPSRRLVNKSNILGTVDCLFHEEYFHNCEMNRQALNSVYTMLDNMT